MLLRNACAECIYYHSENNTCQSKKCATSQEGYVTILDRILCRPRTEDEWTLS